MTGNVKLITVIRACGTTARLLLGVVFIWSSFGKLQYPHDFLSTIYSYGVVGSKIGLLMAVLLPWLEMLVGVCLFAGIWLGSSSFIAAMLLAMYLAAQAIVLWRGLRVGCGCFTVFEHESEVSWLTIMRTSILLSLAFFVSYLEVGAIKYSGHKLSK
jgi:uncharacterized membrane protein YphA (DoxX/SURF4 family)